MDVREERDWISVREQVLAEKAALHVVVNKLGITGFEQGNYVHDPENVTLEEWRKMHQSNLEGVFLGCKHAIRAMCRSGSNCGLQHRCRVQYRRRNPRRECGLASIERRRSRELSALSERRSLGEILSPRASAAGLSHGH
jgi:NAD(P)-dependent dehydrogenase (short-subunit alcohol dehydrogenase family)